MDLNEIMVFIKVVQSGSFRAAGRILGMPNSTVSHKVASLEKRLGVTLLMRTTRRLTVAEDGQAYFARCRVGPAQGGSPAVCLPRLGRRQDGRWQNVWIEERASAPGSMTSATSRART